MKYSETLKLKVESLFLIKKKCSAKVQLTLSKNCNRVKSNPYYDGNNQDECEGFRFGSACCETYVSHFGVHS